MRGGMGVRGVGLVEPRRRALRDVLAAGRASVTGCGGMAVMPDGTTQYVKAPCALLLGYAEHPGVVLVFTNKRQSAFGSRVRIVDVTSRMQRDYATFCGHVQSQTGFGTCFQIEHAAADIAAAEFLAGINAEPYAGRVGTSWHDELVGPAFPAPLPEDPFLRVRII